MIRAAWIIAFIVAALGILGALITGPIILLPAALIPLCAGIGIRRGKAWSSWGFAIYSLCQLLLIPLVLSRIRNPPEAAKLIGAAIWPLGLAVFFFLAGRRLAQRDYPRGSPFPWVILAAVTTVPLFFFEAFVVPTGAMENTILVGDHLLVRVFPRAPAARGDIFALIYPVDRKQTFIKRIVGIPGDRIRISHKQLFVNGAPLNERYVVHKLDYEDSFRDDFPSEATAPIFPSASVMLAENVVNGELIVPQGKYFVLGDNRDQSLDSRYWGFVSDADLIGKPLFIYDSQDRNTEELTNPNGLPLSRTRWNRILKRL